MAHVEKNLEDMPQRIAEFRAAQRAAREVPKLERFLRENKLIADPNKSGKAAKQAAKSSS